MPSSRRSGRGRSADTATKRGFRVKDKYFPDTGPNRWVFTGVLKDEEGQIKVVRLLAASHVRIERHTKIRAEANPYDPAWEPYFEKRLDVQMAARLQGKRWLSSLWREQHGLCPVCHQKITQPGTFRGETASEYGRLRGLSRMWGNSPVRFLGEGMAATPSPYPTVETPKALWDSHL